MSACGPTGVLNILKALKLDLPQLPTEAEMKDAIPSRQRNYETESILQYLESRAKAGTTHVDLIQGTEKISQNQVKGQFFRFDSRAQPSAFRDWLRT